MRVPSVAQLVPILQTAIGPMILISGLGLLLLTMSNRLGRVIDRARDLADERAARGAGDRDKTAAQLAILWKRARIIRMSLALASFSALSSACLIIVLFLTSLEQIDLAWMIIGLFITSMLCLIGSLVLFIRDINQALSALRLELHPE